MAHDTIAGAEYLVSIFGTEKDRVNCPFYYKIGACRHGDKCTRRHNKPNLSQTIMLVNFWQNPLTKPNYNTLNPKQLEEDFEDFYIDVFDEFSKYGYVEELHICDNVSDHMVGNVYVQFANEEDAMRAMQALTGRFFGGRAVVAEYSPVTDFREASCRQYEHNECTRGGYCNFLHLKALRPEIKRALFRSQKRDGKRRERSRSRSKERRRERSRSKSRERKRRSRSRERDEKRQRRGNSRERRPRDDNRGDPRMDQRDPRGDPRDPRDPRLESRGDPRDPRQNVNEYKMK